MEKLGKVLCVDDEPMILRSLEWLLRKNFDVATASSGQEGLGLVRSGDYDLVISDQRMPGMTGAEFLREVRRISPRSMRILLTGYSDLDAVLRSVNESEVFRFVRKPWDIRELQDLAAEACRIAREQPALLVARDASSESVVQDDQVREPVLFIEERSAIEELLPEGVRDMLTLYQTTNPAEAMALLEEHDIGIVVSDTRISGVDMTRLLKLLKQRRPQTVTLVVSDKTDADTVIGLINQGQVYRFIPRPVNPEFMQLMIRSAIGKHRELCGNPELAVRHRVERLGDEVIEELQVELNAAASAVLRRPGLHEERGEGSLFGRMSRGLRQLFDS